MELTRMSPVAYLSRIETFSAGHRLHSDKLSPEENLKVYGKCNNPNGHGHNYKVEVTVKGQVNEITGMIITVAELKQYFNSVLEVVDHKNLDKDVAYFKDKVSTTENVSIFFWKSLEQLLPKSVQLHRIKVAPTDHNVVRYYGESI